MNEQQVLARQNTLQHQQRINLEDSSDEEEKSPGQQYSASKLKRSQSSSNTQGGGVGGGELNAINSDIKNQYEDQIIANRPKGSRNVLNNVNKQVKKKEESRSSSSESESSESSSDGDRVDHTYNPYSFKKIQKAIFNKKKPVPPQELSAKLQQVQNQR